MQSQLQLALFSNLADLECGTPSLEIGMCLQIGQRFIENSLISNEECTILPASYILGPKLTDHDSQQLTPGSQGLLLTSGLIMVKALIQGRFLVLVKGGLGSIYLAT